MNRPHRFRIMGEVEELTVLDALTAPTDKGLLDVDLETSRGTVVCRYRRVPGASKAVVLVGGTGGDFDSPAGDLYSRLEQELPENGLATLRVRYRYPDDLTESTLDVLAGVELLRREGIATVALIGHSLGGAAVIQAAALEPVVRAVVALSTQSSGADAVTLFGDGVASLFIHGGEDRVLPSRCSSYAFSLAKEPKELIIHDGAGHDLNGVAEEVRNEVTSWISANLR